MTNRVVHIITHDVPWPADFGGVMDQFYKIKTLHQQGVKIHLHCFVKNRPPQQELNKYCETVHYYPRKKIKAVSLLLPYIVRSRLSEQLVQNLKKDNHPVLMEGVHCTYYLYKGFLKNRLSLLRLHNTEFEYYHQLAVHEKNPLKKLYFKAESWLLKRYEKKIAHKTAIGSLSLHDAANYRQLGASNVFHLPAFIPYTQPMGLAGSGCYCLYHGNLSVNENEEAAIWLLQNVFNQLPIPFVIAGKAPSQRLEYLAHQHEHTCLVANPSDKELHDMIAKAHINILPSFNSTGVKLKLLNALYNGRYCLVNTAGVAGTGLDKLCWVAEDAEGFKTIINELFSTPFDEAENDKRITLLQQYHHNDTNFKKIEAVFWSNE